MYTIFREGVGMYSVEFYRAPGGGCPIEEFLGGLQVKVRAKTAKWLQLLQEEGPDLRRPYADMLQDGIRELRLSFGHIEVRILYFIEGKDIVLTNGFLKKTDRVPQAEIELALRRRAQWLEER
jgi:phage-related protein